MDKDRDALLVFYNFPTFHWQPIQTANPIESTFATIRLRTNQTRGCVSRETILSMIYKLGKSARKRWRRLRDFERLAEVIEGVKFTDGVRADTDKNGRVAA